MKKAAFERSRPKQRTELPEINSFDDVIKSLQLVMSDAHASGKFGDVIRAAKVLASLLKDKQEKDGTIESKDLEKVPTEVLEQLAQAIK